MKGVRIVGTVVSTNEGSGGHLSVASLDKGFASAPVAQPAPYGVTETIGALIAAGRKFSGRSPDYHGDFTPRANEHDIR